MNRREFLTRAAVAAGAGVLASKSLSALMSAPLGQKFQANDTVTLGKTGIKTSRLAMGTGTYGFGHTSQQSKLGVKGLSDILLNGYDQGLRFFDSADAYGSHPHVAEALKSTQRDKVTVLTKSWSRDPDGIRADLDRFRRELKTDYIDVFLMHCLTDGDWTERHKEAMDVLSRPSRRESSALMDAHATASRLFEQPLLRHGWRSIWSGLIPSALTWTPTRLLSSASSSR
jgi:hypothetical protein